MGRKLIDLTGRRFGRLTVIERASNKGIATMYLCKCDCGNILNIQYSNLKKWSSILRMSYGGNI